MELILNSVEQFKELSTELRHIIVRPVIKTLQQAIELKNDAQQVHLLNLLKVIIFEGNFYTKEMIKQSRYSQSAEKLFTDPLFFSCVYEGIKNPEAFVRSQFIIFSKKIVPFIYPIVKPKEFSNIISNFIKSFCRLLSTVDVSQYQTESRLGGKRITKGVELLIERVLQRSATNGYGWVNNNNSASILINQETDINELIDGLSTIIHYCLNIKKGLMSIEEQRED